MDIKRNKRLSQFTSLGIGGPAEYFLLARSREELVEGLKFALEKDLAITMLGAGANSLIADEGIPGLTVKFQNTTYDIRHTTIEAGAGTPIGVLVQQASAAGLSGLEWAGGLPGTLGGAIFGNAGTHGKATDELLVSVDVLELPDMEIKTIDAKDLWFGYRDSTFKSKKAQGEFIILGAVLRFAPGDKDEIRKATLESVQFRITHHPPERSCGSIFKNPEVTPEVYERIAVEFPQIKQVRPGQGFETLRAPVGFLLEQAGMKGKRAGDAQISDHHANFIVNHGHARAADVYALITQMQEVIAERFGITIEPEIRLLPKEAFLI